MGEKLKLSAKSVVLADGENEVIFEELANAQREEYAKKIMEQAGNILSRYLSENPKEAENL